MSDLSGQIDYWDSEGRRADYCARQISWLNSLGVRDMVTVALRNFKGAPKRILEIGGGSQYVSRYLCQIFPEAEIICSDISEKRMEDFNRFYGSKPKNLQLRGGVDAKALPFRDKEFDLIVGDAMLHHIDFLKPALFEVRRCLAEDGQAVFVREPIIGTLGVMIYRLFQVIEKDHKHIELNYFEYKRMLSQWRYEFMMAGFTVETIKSWPNQDIYSRCRTLFPSLTPCYIGFLLKGRGGMERLSLGAR